MSCADFVRVVQQSVGPLFPNDRAIALNDGLEPKVAAGGETLIAAIRAVLRATGHYPLRDLDVEVLSGVVVLRGRVANYYQKQLAQAAVQQVRGVCGVANGLEVAACLLRDASKRV